MLVKLQPLLHDTYACLRREAASRDDGTRVGLAIMNSVRDVFYGMTKKVTDRIAFDEKFGAEFVEGDAERIGDWSVHDMLRKYRHLNHSWNPKRTLRGPARIRRDERLGMIVAALCKARTQPVQSAAAPTPTPTPAPTPARENGKPSLTAIQKEGIERKKLHALAVKGSKIRTSADNFNNLKNREGWHKTVDGFGCIPRLVIRTIVGLLTRRNLNANGLSVVNLAVETVLHSVEIKEKLDALLISVCKTGSLLTEEGDFDTIRVALLTKMCNARIGEFIAAHDGVKGVRMALRAALKPAKS